MTFERFDGQLAMLLRDQPRGVAIDLADFAVAYWDGRRVVYAFLHEDGSGVLDEEFAPEDFIEGFCEREFSAALAAPRYVSRPEIIEWLKDAPPYESAG